MPQRAQQSERMADSKRVRISKREGALVRTVAYVILLYPPQLLANSLVGYLSLLFLTLESCEAHALVSGIRDTRTAVVARCRVWYKEVQNTSRALLVVTNTGTAVYQYLRACSQRRILSLLYPPYQVSATRSS